VSDESHLHHEIARGGKAQRLLDDEIYTGAMTSLRETLLEGLDSAKTPEARERFWLSRQLLKHLEFLILDVANTGKIARKQLDMIAGQKSLAQKLRIVK
jgi:hypothetical protein